MKPFETQRRALACLLMFSFIGWVNVTAFPGFAQGQTPDSAARKPIKANMSEPAGNSRANEAENQACETPVFEKSGNAMAKVQKKHFPWLGVILSVALVGGLVYYFFILKNTLQVSTTPAGARIFLDGKDSGKISPCRLEPRLGAHTIKAVLEGYADVEREVIVKNGKNAVTILLDIGTFDISSPAANANVQRETACPIRWDSTAMEAALARPAANRALAVTKVNIELYQEGAKVSDIARAVPNSGSYTWNVPAAAAEGHNFKILVSCSDLPEARAFSSAFNLLGFREDFTDNRADFWLPDNTADWRAAGGYFTARKTNARLAVAIYDFFYGESSYTVESRMRWTERSGHESGAPLFIMLGSSNSFTGNSGYVLGYGMDGAVSVFRVENYNLLDPAPGQPTVLYSGSSSAVNQGLGNWNTVKVVRSESSYALYINNTLACTVVDSTFKPTHVMIGFGGAGEKTSCDFDYVHMTVNPGN